jgi:hypothetical protein
LDLQRNLNFFRFSRSRQSLNSQSQLKFIITSKRNINRTTNFMISSPVMRTNRSVVSRGHLTFQPCCNSSEKTIVYNKIACNIPREVAAQEVVDYGLIINAHCKELTRYTSVSGLNNLSVKTRIWI